MESGIETALAGLWGDGKFSNIQGNFPTLIELGSSIIQLFLASRRSEVEESFEGKRCKIAPRLVHGGVESNM